MSEPTFKQMQEFFRQVDAGRITSANFQEFLKNSDVFLKANVVPFAVAANFALSNTAVKFSYIGDNFKSWFYGKTEEAQDVSIPRLHHDLRNNKNSLNCEILFDLGGEAKAEVTMAGVYELLKLQPNGQQGILLTDVSANIFYVRDINSVLRVVDVVGWDGDGWGVDAFSVGLPIGWFAGDRVFSR